MENRFYLQALGVTGLFVGLMILFWIASGGQAASQAEVQNANNTRTAIAMTGSYLLQPRSQTPAALTPSSLPETSVPGATSTLPPVPSATNTSLLSQLNTPVSPVESSIVPSMASSITPYPTLTPFVQVPVFTITPLPGHINTKSPPLLRQPGAPTVVQPPVVQPSAVQPGIIQDPAEFARWYFARVWNERDYQNLWDNYLTISYKANVGSGLFEDYVWWWNSVGRVDVNSVDVLQNNGTDAWVRVNLTFHMQDGRVIENQVYDYDFLYDPSRQTWMFDSST